MPEQKPGDVIRAFLEGALLEGPDSLRPVDDVYAALSALDDLEAERDVLKHAAALVENPEYVTALQQAGVEYVEQLVARIAELEAAVERLEEEREAAVTAMSWAENRLDEARATVERLEGELDLLNDALSMYQAGVVTHVTIERAALPDTEGSAPVTFQHGQPAYGTTHNARRTLPDTEGPE